MLPVADESNVHFSLVNFFCTRQRIVQRVETMGSKTLSNLVAFQHVLKMQHQLLAF